MKIIRQNCQATKKPHLFRWGLVVYETVTSLAVVFSRNTCWLIWSGTVAVHKSQLSLQCSNVARLASANIFASSSTDIVTVFVLLFIFIRDILSKFDAKSAGIGKLYIDSLLESYPGVTYIQSV
jgi:hypothetical protein